MNAPSLSSSPRASRPLQIRAWTCALVAVLAAANACSDAGSSSATPPTVGESDRPSNGAITIDEPNLVAIVTGGELRLDVPVSAVKDAKGDLTVSLIPVDGGKTLETTPARYDLVASNSVVLNPVLHVPSDVVGQADWVRYSVRIDDGAARTLRVTSSLLRVVRPYEVRLEGPGKVSKDKPVSYRVRAQHPVTKAPLHDVDVEMDVQKDGVVVQTVKAKTSSTGDAIVPVTMNATGNYTVQAKTDQNGTTAKVSHDMVVAEPGRKVLLTTDKPIYQPGQTVHLRALALAPPKNTPLSGSAAVFEVSDGKGNKVFHKELTTDTYGVASADFVIGGIVNEGGFKTSVTVGGATTEKTVDVSHYALPKFGLDLGVDKSWYGPGETVTGTVDARYFFGKAVATADVVIEGYTLDIGETVFQKIVGKTDASGKMSFTLALPTSLVGLPLEQGNAIASVRVKVTDTAGQVVTKETAVTVAQDGVRITVVPESTTIAPGIENRLEIFATDPLGGGVPNAPIVLEMGTATLNATTDAFGHAEARFTPGAAADSFSVTASVTPPKGATVTKQLTFGGQTGSEHVLVRADKSVYDVGDTVTVEVLASGSAAHATIDWLNEGQAVDMRTVDLAGGSGTFTMTLDGSLLGSNRVEAYIVDDGGNVVRSGRTLFVRGDSALDVSVQADKTTYAPGEAATLTFSVKDPQGNPTVAALGVQVVDEAVFGLVDARPGLLRTYFELEDEYAKPAYEIDAPPVSLSDVLFDKTRSKNADEQQAGQAQAEATFAAMGGSSITGIQEASWPKVVLDAKTMLAPYFVTAKTELAKVVGPIAAFESQVLAAEGCSPTVYYCDTLQKTFYDALSLRLRDAFIAIDFWGNPYAKETGGYAYVLTLTTSGPDEKPGTADDATISLTPTDVGLDAMMLNHSGVGLGGPEANFGAAAPGLPQAGAGGSTSAGGASGVAGGPSTGSGAPRVRRSFPETLYVNPEVITGADGTAQVKVDLADSITKWRVSTLANSASGQLGGGLGSMTVFQDFFVDVSFPATLTRGDEVEFPIAVYNYLTTAQTVHLTLQPGSWYTALGVTAIDVPLQPGEVTGVRFPVRVEQVGRQSLTVQALGTKVSDAVERSVTVVPDGKAFPETHSGSLGAGTVSHTVTLPANAIAGSQKVYLTVFPGYLSQVVQGMDSLLRVPNGCFEQTTSTTWPNVLATDYMQSTKQITPDVLLKAESYINAGYQRLLTFEHPGGGFSWFGTQDPAPFLSVTALGVMEFADMAKVHPVDSAMIDRTKAWLVSQQKTDGSWPGDKSEFFTFQTSAVRNTAFVVWALGSAGNAGPELGRGLDYVKTNLGKEAPDPYTLGLVANAFALAAPSDAFGTQVLADLDAAKQTNGTKIFWDSAGTQTNFYGNGNDAAVATTGIVTHAMLLAGGFPSDVTGALEYIAGSKDPNGNFGSTQATVWALRALVLAATKGTETATGTLTVSVDGVPFTKVALTKAQSDLMTTVDLSTLATAGAHDVTLAFTGQGKLSYNLVDSYNLSWPDVPAETGPLAITVDYDKTTLRLDETVQATVTVSNTTAGTENMVLVTVGIPPGFSLNTDDLDLYKKSGVLSQYEVTEKQLTLYLTTLAPNAAQAFQYHLTATMPVVAADGGAQAFLYYEPANKVSAVSRKLQVTGS
jgi:hypothetical protein